MHIIKERMWNLIREMETIKKQTKFKTETIHIRMKNSEDKF